MQEMRGLALIMAPNDNDPAKYVHGYLQPSVKL